MDEHTAIEWTKPGRLAVLRGCLAYLIFMHLPVERLCRRCYLKLLEWGGVYLWHCHLRDREAIQ